MRGLSRLRIGVCFENRKTGFKKSGTLVLSYCSNHYPGCSKASLQLGVRLTAAGCPVGNQRDETRQLLILTAC